MLVLSGPVKSFHITPLEWRETFQPRAQGGLLTESTNVRSLVPRAKPSEGRTLAAVTAPLSISHSKGGRRNGQATVVGSRVELEWSRKAKHYNSSRRPEAFESPLLLCGKLLSERGHPNLNPPEGGGEGRVAGQQQQQRRPQRDKYVPVTRDACTALILPRHHDKSLRKEKEKKNWEHVQQ